MSDRIFLDTYILVYAHTDINSTKQAVCQRLARNPLSFMSTQVMQELANTLSRKFRHPWQDIEKVLDDCVKNSTLHVNTEKTVVEACHLADHYQFSFYDSLILSAALECECSVLYSEDLSHGQIIEKTLTISNPFI